MTKTEILIMRALLNAKRHQINGNKKAAKDAFDKAWNFYINDMANVGTQIENNIYWVKDNYYEIKAHRYLPEEPRWISRKLEVMEADHAGL